MRGFLVVGNKASTKPFNLNDLAGSAGRMDILCRCVAQAFFISHGIRKDVEIYLLLLGEPNPPKAIKIAGNEVKNMAPDERCIAGLLRKALTIESDDWRRSSPGIYTARKNLADLLKEQSEKYRILYLREDGENIENIEDIDTLKDPLFVLGDHLGLRKEMEDEVLKYAKRVISISPLSLQADQCIVIAHYELDKKEQKERLMR